MSAHHGTSGKRGSGSPYESDAEPRYDVQTWRKIAYYAGAALTLLGFVLFFVPFLSVFSFFDGLSSGSGGSGPGSFVAFRDFPLAFVGFFLILAGQGLRAVGRRGSRVPEWFFRPKGRPGMPNRGGVRGEPRCKTLSRRCRWSATRSHRGPRDNHRSGSVAPPAGISRPRTPGSAPGAGPRCSPPDCRKAASRPAGRFEAPSVRLRTRRGVS